MKQPFSRGQRGVVRLPVLETRHVVGRQSLDQRLRPRPLDTELPHVAHVEQTRGRTDRVVLFNDAREAHRHFPAGKIHELATELSVKGV